MPDTILITGANRGLGFHFTKYYAESGWKVFACCRTPEKASDLKQLAHLYPEIEICRLDITDQTQIKTFTAQLSGQAIDILLNNAGVYGNSGIRLGHLLLSDWLEIMAVNCIGPMLLAQELLPNVVAGKYKLIVAIGSRMSSMTENTYGNAYYYRTSKAALNAAIKSMAIDVREQNVACVCVDPGWVKTDLGGPQAPLSPEESVASLTKLFQSLGLYDSGKFFTRLGEEIPW